MLFAVVYWFWSFFKIAAVVSGCCLLATDRSLFLFFSPPPPTAVDGVTNGFFSENSVTHTAGHGLNNDPNPWWQVDLGSEQTVGTIRLWNRIILFEHFSDMFK